MNLLTTLGTPRSFPMVFMWLASAPGTLHKMCGADTHGLQTWEEAPPPSRYAPVETEYFSMQTTITAKLKLGTTPEQFAALLRIQLAYWDALNQASQYAFAHGKTSKSQRLHHALYEEVRATSGLPSQMACSVFRQVGATYKGLWTKW